MSDPIVHHNIGTWNFAARAKGLHADGGRLATLTLTTQDGKFEFKVDPTQFPWVGNNDVLIGSFTLMKTQVLPAPPPSEAILRHIPH